MYITIYRLFLSFIPNMDLTISLKFFFFFWVKLQITLAYVFNSVLWGQRIWQPGPLHIKPKVRVEKEEMSEDERRRSKLPEDVAEDNPVLGKPRSWKEEVAHHQRQSPRASQGKAQVQQVSHGNIMEEQFQDKLSPPH